MRVLRNSQLLRGLVIGVFTVLASLGVIFSPDLPEALVGLVITVATIVTIVADKKSSLPKDQVVSYVDHPNWESQFRPLVPGPARPPTGYSDTEIADISRRVGA